MLPEQVGVSDKQLMHRVEHCRSLCKTEFTRRPSNKGCMHKIIIIVFPELFFNAKLLFLISLYNYHIGTLCFNSVLIEE